MVIDMEKLKELRKDLEKLERLNDLLKEIHRNIELLKTAHKLGLIDPKFENFVKSLEESHLYYETQCLGAKKLVASHSELELHEDDASHVVVETQNTRASQGHGDSRYKNASQNAIETQTNYAK